MAAAHPFGAVVGCRFKRIGCVRRIKVNNHYTKSRHEERGASMSVKGEGKLHVSYGCFDNFKKWIRL